jgi:hypothetical protein
VVEYLSFNQTNQADVLNNANLSSIVNGIHKVCAIFGTVSGNASVADGPTTTVASPQPTSAAVEMHRVGVLVSVFVGILLSALVF